MKLWFFFKTDATQVQTPKDTSLVDIHLAEDGEKKKRNVGRNGTRQLTSSEVDGFICRSVRTHNSLFHVQTPKKL